MTDTAAYIRSMEVSQPLMEPIVRAAIATLRLPPGSRGLDAGCGIGLQALLLAESVGPAGNVTGLDIVPEFLCHAEVLAQASELSGRVTFREGDVRALPFEAQAFDWAWSAFCIGYAAALEPISSLRELARVVRPGGTVAILVWSSENLLPGYPLLESRLRATAPGIAPFAKGQEPASHPLCALGWFRQVGLHAPTVHTFVADACAPLSDDLRPALTALLEMRWPNVETELAAEDVSAYQRLCRPESPAFILNHPDYYAFYTCSMFTGQVPLDAPL